MKFTTAVGRTVELSLPLLGKPYMYCHGCGPGSGRKLPQGQAKEIANKHAARCRANSR